MAVTDKGKLPLASRKQEYIDGLGNVHEWTNEATCVIGAPLVLDIIEVVLTCPEVPE